MSNKLEEQMVEAIAESLERGEVNSYLEELNAPVKKANVLMPGRSIAVELANGQLFEITINKLNRTKI